MKNTFFSILILLVISCNSLPGSKETTKVENEVERIPEKVEDAVESIEHLVTEKIAVLEAVREAFKPTPLIANILEQLKIKPITVYDEFIAQKVLPYDSTSTVVVLPIIASLDDDAYSFSLHSYILVVDSETGTIKQQFYESNHTNGWDSDAIRIAEITIDTANYKVTDYIRAFGIKLYFIGASKPNPYSSKTISLFIPVADKLLKILDSYEVYSHWGEWDMRCTGEFMEVHKTLIMNANQSNGFYDIQVRVATTTTETFEKGEDDCDEIKTTKKSKQHLENTNGTYEMHTDHTH